MNARADHSYRDPRALLDLIHSFIAHYNIAASFVSSRFRLIVVVSSLTTSPTPNAASLSPNTPTRKPPPVASSDASPHARPFHRTAPPRRTAPTVVAFVVSRSSLLLSPTPVARARTRPTPIPAMRPTTTTTRTRRTRNTRPRARESPTPPPRHRRRRNRHRASSSSSFSSRRPRAPPSRRRRRRKNKEGKTPGVARRPSSVTADRRASTSVAHPTGSSVDSRPNNQRPFLTHHPEGLIRPFTPGPFPHRDETAGCPARIHPPLCDAPRVTTDQSRTRTRRHTRCKFSSRLVRDARRDAMRRRGDSFGTRGVDDGVVARLGFFGMGARARDGWGGRPSLRWRACSDDDACSVPSNGVTDETTARSR